MLIFNSYALAIYCVLLFLVAIPAIALSAFTLRSWWELRTQGTTLFVTSLPADNEPLPTLQYTHTPKQAWLPPAVTLIGFSLFISGLYMMRPTEEVEFVDESSLEEALLFIPRLLQSKPGHHVQFVCEECAVILSFTHEVDETVKILAYSTEASDESKQKLRELGLFDSAETIRDLDGEVSEIMRNKLPANEGQIRKFTRNILECLAPNNTDKLRIQVTSSFSS